MSTVAEPLPAPPQAWLDDLAAARADHAAGRVREIDLEALCLEIEAEAAEIADRRQQHVTPFRA